MTVYLWHLTVLALLVGLAHLAGGIGLHWSPGSVEWWWGRIPWFLALAMGLTLLLPLVGRFERSPPLPEGFQPSTARILGGAALVSAGIAFLALGGIAVEGGVGVQRRRLALTTGCAAGTRRRSGHPARPASGSKPPVAPAMQPARSARAPLRS